MRMPFFCFSKRSTTIIGMREVRNIETPIVLCPVVAPLHGTAPGMAHPHDAGFPTVHSEKIDCSMKYSAHENFARDEAISVGSDRSFGLVMAAGCAVLASLSVWREGHAWPVLAAIAIFFLVTALFIPTALHSLNRAWLKLGLLLHKIVNPVVMGLIFYGAVLPTGLVMRFIGRDLLRLKPQPEAGSYWIIRTPPGPAPKTMKDQF